MNPTISVAMVRQVSISYKKEQKRCVWGLLFSPYGMVVDGC